MGSSNHPALNSSKRQFLGDEDWEKEGMASAGGLLITRGCLGSWASFSLCFFFFLKREKKAFYFMGGVLEQMAVICVISGIFVISVTCVISLLCPVYTWAWRVLCLWKGFCLPGKFPERAFPSLFPSAISELLNRWGYLWVRCLWTGYLWRGHLCGDRYGWDSCGWDICGWIPVGATGISPVGQSRVLIKPRLWFLSLFGPLTLGHGLHDP